MKTLLKGIQWMSALAMCLGITQFAQAASVTYTYKGNIDSQGIIGYHSSASLIRVGDPFSGTLSFETEDVSDLNDMTPDSGVYRVNGTHQFHQEYIGTSSSEFSIEIYAKHPLTQDFSNIFQGIYFNLQPSIPASPNDRGIKHGGLLAFYADSYGSPALPLSDDSLEQALDIVLEDWVAASLELFFDHQISPDGGMFSGGLFGYITEFTKTSHDVPSPNALGLIAIGLTAAGFAWRRRKAGQDWYSG
ncbi:PEP-CTERM sorting domain-containing protein [Aestuariispira insulae]|uniref:Putative secreted protein with PEP-CTERM sorting signal n=1 Tax=Aestuariispira insulae TaxID=1461337 RepID=A0A3D9HWI7_9PROT|nr:PEP-CTERM sorting domain-containing protein [Aestuariispira insulae]RED53874.1 putative secreted protein with PEP-CTERM sorting signal [Aestuariispira insulae]